MSFHSGFWNVFGEHRHLPKLCPHTSLLSHVMCLKTLPLPLYPLRTSTLLLCGSQNFHFCLSRFYYTVYNTIQIQFSHSNCRETAIPLRFTGQECKELLTYTHIVTSFHVSYFCSCSHWYLHFLASISSRGTFRILYTHPSPL